MKELDMFREVYQITKWLRGGTTYNSRWPQGTRRSGRWEFVGPIADDKIRRKYVNRSVDFPEGSQNPIVYRNC